MEAEKVVHCLRTLKNTLEKTISKKPSLSKRKKGREKHSKGLGACSSRGTVKRINCCKGCRAESQISQVIKWKTP